MLLEEKTTINIVAENVKLNKMLNFTFITQRFITVRLKIFFVAQN